MMNDVVFAETDRLLIRKLKRSDRKLVEKLNDECSPIKEDDEYGGLNKLYHKILWRETKSSDTVQGLLFLRSDGAFVGKISISIGEDGLPELGLDIMEAYRNNGYGPEAVIAFCNWYAAEYHTDTLKVRAKEDNVHSIHVLEKLGAEFVMMTTAMSDDFIKMVKASVPDMDFWDLTTKNIREYRLHIPIETSDKS